MLILVNIDYYLEYPREVLKSLHLGGVFYGGLLTALLAGIWFVRRWGLLMWKVGVILAPSIALGQGIDTRFFIEFFRGDYRGSLFQGLLSTSQFVSLLTAPLSIIMLLYLRRKHPLT